MQPKLNEGNGNIRVINSLEMYETLQDMCDLGDWGKITQIKVTASYMKVWHTNTTLSINTYKEEGESSNSNAGCQL